MMQRTAGLLFLLLEFLHLSTTSATASDALRREVLETFFRLRVVAAAVDIEKVSGCFAVPCAMRGGVRSSTGRTARTTWS